MVAAWQGYLEPKSLRHFVDLHFAFDRSVEAIRDGKYVDGHCWVFTAGSLTRILADLVELDLLPYRCARLYEPEPNTNEFQLILQKCGQLSGTAKEQAKQSFLSHDEKLEDDIFSRTQIAAELVRDLEGKAEELRLEKAEHEATKSEALLLEQRVGELEALVSSLLSSRSFRLTAPLRKLAALARKS